jgi:hypothetical protein
MPLLPSLDASAGRALPWSVPRVACYGVGIGVLAALFKMFGPLHAAGATAHLGGLVANVAAAALAFALLCGGVAALRNFIARSLVWHE